MSAKGGSRNSVKNCIRILLADAIPTFREGLGLLLGREKDMEVVGSAGDGEEVLRMAEELLPDVILMDPDLPKLSGLEVAHHLRKAHIPVVIILLTAETDSVHFLDALRVSVEGYLLKDIPPQSLLACIRLSYEKKHSVLDYRVASSLRILLIEHIRSLAQLNRSTVSGESKWFDDSREKGSVQGILGNRELEVLRLVGGGMNNKEIAAHLTISERTVQNHLHNIYIKMGTNSRSDAVLRAVKRGLISFDTIH